MLFRRMRKHHHGASNLASPHAHHRSSLDFKPSQTLPSETPLSQFARPSSTIKKRAKSRVLASEPFVRKEKSVFVGEAERVIKKKYKGRKNVRKILDQWGVGASGFIDSQDFKSKIAQKSGLDIQPAEMEQIARKYSNDSNQVDVKGLLELVFMKSEGLQFNQTIFKASRPNDQRERKINDLSEKLEHFSKGNSSGAKFELTDSNLNKLMSKINSSISRMKQKRYKTESREDFFEQILGHSKYSDNEREMVEQIKKGVDFEEVKCLVQAHKNVDNAMLDPIMRKVKPVEERKSEAENTEPMHKTQSHTLYRAIQSEERASPFNPVNLLNKDQRKTRFGGSKFTSQSDNWFPTPKKTNWEPRDQKEHVLRQLRSEQDLKRCRYQNKLEKMRQWRQKEQENVAGAQAWAQSREEGSLARRRHEQEAYNYVNFLKKKWE